MLADALQELEDRVRAEVQRRLADADAHDVRQLELARHAEDYRTWRRMGEAPEHVVALSKTVSQSVLATDSDQLLTDLVKMLERIYTDLALTRPESPADDEYSEPHR
ncbi:MAG: hypothetical protein AAGH76_14345 [Pseudomonadota bacterium]